MDVISTLARRGLFRERDLEASNLSHNWLHVAEGEGLVTRHGHGVWSSRSYAPTRYELVQIRFPKAVFWGPSALWLLGAAPAEPDALWVAIANRSRPPGTLELGAVIIRTRKLDHDVVSLRPEGRRLSLRVHGRERAQADVARADLHRLLTRAASREQFTLPREATFLSPASPFVRWHPLPAPREQWVAEQHLSPRAASRSPA